MNLMNGTIDVDTVKGEGTCFTVRLPTDPPATTEGQSSPASSTTDTG
jgi:signal transduction histidine kinase